MWRRHVGIDKSHFYPTGKQTSTTHLIASCGMSYAAHKLVIETTDKTRCTICTKLYVDEYGLFA